MPLIRRIPKRGFNNPWGTNFAIVNVGELEANFKAGEEVTLESLKKVGLCKRPCDALKVLGDGELKKKLKITAHKFSQTALDKIQKAGGEAVTIPGPKPVVRKKPRAKAKA
jgi:large subunit ribosomal protein L15